MRLRADVRSRTRCIRRRNRSRSARSSSEGSHSAGTRSRRHNSASTRASTLSVLHANGAMSRDLARMRHDIPAGRGQPIANPHRATHHLHTRPDLRAERQHEPGQAVLVGRHHPSPLIAPPSLSAHHAARRYAQSMPTYRIAGPPLTGSATDRRSVCSRETLRHDGRPSVMTFHATKRRHGGRPGP